MTKLRTLRQGNYPALSGWAPNAVNSVLVRERQQDLTHTEDKVMRRQGQRLEGCGQKWENAGSHQKPEEARDGLPSRASRGRASWQRLDFRPWDWGWTSASRAMREYKFLLPEATRVVTICYNSHTSYGDKNILASIVGAVWQSLWLLSQQSGFRW